MTQAVVRTIPQPRIRPIIGNVPDVGMTTPVQSMMRLAKELGPLYRLTFPGQTLLVASSQALVDELCDETRFDKHVHSVLKHLRDFAGDALFTAETHEPNWERAHRILMPAFGPAAMRDMFEPMLDVAEQMMEKWERLGPGAEIDVADNMTRLTLDTIALSGFGFRFNSFYQREMHPFVDAMVRSLAEAGARSRRPPLQTILMLATQRQYQRDNEYMNSVVDQVIRERRAAGTAGAKSDLLGLMLTGEDPVTHARLDDENIRYQIVTFLVAGHETTSGLLSFTIYQLLKHPEVLARAREEVDRVFGRDSQKKPSFEQIHKLTYLDQVLRESLRLWPTAPAFGVHAKEDTTLGHDFKVKKGDPIIVLIPTLHRDPAVWIDPERFDPDRFVPAAVEARPANSWKPFGTGQRACIGRQFAMQEATLVLAMILQRFTLVDHANYQLSVKETLTLKPDGLMMKVQPRGNGPALAITPSVPPPTDAPVKWTREQAPSHGTPLLVLFGSNMGSSERFARRIASDAALRGYTPTCAPMDDFAGKLPKSGGVVIVTASYNGQPPDNARAFVRWTEGLKADELKGVRFAIFGCGHRDWPTTFQAVPKAVEARLLAAGAERLTERGEADAAGDFFGEFDSWIDPAWPTLGAAFGIDADSAVAELPRFEVERVAKADPLDLAHGLGALRVLENRELVDVSSPLGRSKRHLEFALPKGSIYRVGDYLSVLPENSLALVTRAARRFILELDESIIIRKAREERTNFPLDRAVSVRELLTSYVELQAPATRRDIRALAQHTACPPEKKALLALADESAEGKERFRTEILEKRVSVLDLLERFAACELPFARFLDLLPELQPRLYSIASSPLADSTKVSLTISVVDAEAFSGAGRYRGTASNYLASLKPGDTVRAAIRESRGAFHLPHDPSTPVIMIAAGTGIAPFRGFVEERASLRANGASLGDAHLYFGCDHPDVDFIYRDQLAKWKAAEIFPAFFKKPEDEVTFVQHRVWKERDRVIELLDRGAHVYVCGDGRRMAPAVKDAIKRIYQEKKGVSDEIASQWLAKLEADGRYVADVFTG